MIPAALIGVGAQAGLGVLGEILASMDEADAERLIKQATDQYGKIDLPALKQIVAEQLGPSDLSKIQSDPELVSAQKDALAEVLRVGRDGGLRLEDKAALNEATGAAARAGTGNYRRVLEDRAQRGISGSGDELVASMKAGQDAAQGASNAGLRVAADAQRRSLDAMLSGGRLAGEMRGQEFGEKSRVAEAQDAIKRFNAEGRTAASQYNNQIAQQGFGNQMTVLDRKAGGLRDQAQLKRDAAAGKRSMFSGGGAAAARGGQAYDNYQYDQEYLDAQKKKGG